VVFDFLGFTDRPRRQARYYPTNNSINQAVLACRLGLGSLAGGGVKTRFIPRSSECGIALLRTPRSLNSTLEQALRDFN
jgi:hypothetical protein